MSPAVTSAKPGESTSAADPNTFFSSPPNSLQISYTATDGQLTNEELPSFPQFSADVEDIMAYPSPIASSSQIQGRDRTAHAAASLIGMSSGNHNHTRYEYDHLNKNGEQMYCNQEERQIDVSMKLVTIMSDPDQANPKLFLQEGQTNSSNIPTPSKSPELSDEEDQQEPGIYIDQTIFEESISSDLEVNYSDSVNSDLEGELQETLSSSSSEDIRTDSATSELEKELIPITQKLERAHYGPEPPSYEFHPDCFERSSVPEAEVIAACMSTQDYNPPPTPGAESDFSDFNSPPPTPDYNPSPPVSADDNHSSRSPNFERPPTPTPTLSPIPESVPEVTPVAIPEPEAISVLTPEPTAVPILKPISMPTPESTHEPISMTTPISTSTSTPAPVSMKTPISTSTPEQISMPTPISTATPISSPILMPTPKTNSIAAEDDSPPVLTSIYEDVIPEITKPNNEGASRVSNNTNSESPPPVLVRETPCLPFQAISAGDPMKKRRGTRKFITPKGQIMIPHSSAEIQERVKNRQRNSVSSYCSSVSSENSMSKSEPSSPTMDAQIYTEHKYFKSNGTQPEEKCTKVKSKRGRKRKGSEEQRPVKKSKPENGLYIVEKILRKTIVGGVPYFLVKWLNYTDAKNTWEPAENFSVELITAFENSLLEASSKPKKVEPPAKRVLIPPLIRRSDSAMKKKCAGCASYPTTFTDQRSGETGFDRGYTYSKTRESFVLDGVKCGLVEFDEKRVLELIPFSIINEKVRAQLVT